ncbi:MAG: TetR/AcrR family transcriptional regulator C-terminal domain-containing protein [Eubacteriaceae bacterium]|nr:TetR/AcrR family transcriptional regulator C-terminal domain-containing protein [Eubacteriaceae bacterium]
MGERTKDVLAEGLRQLLEEKLLDRITVRELTGKCHMGRNTFYYHFRDIYELMDWMFIGEAEKIINGLDDKDDWQRGMTQAMNYIFENKNVIYNIYNSINKQKIENYLYDVMQGIIFGFVTRQTGDNDIPVEYKKKIADFFRYALVGWVFQWMENGMKETPEKVVSDLDGLLDGVLEKILGNAKRK